jgi:hypothetical protein
MDKLKNIEFIETLSNGNNPFFEELEEGNFNKSIFHDYTRAIYELSKTELTIKEKYDCAIMIWEINHHIQNFLISHFDSRDIFHFNNLEEDDSRQLKNILFYSANWFSYNKELDLEHLKFGSWK